MTSFAWLHSTGIEARLVVRGIGLSCAVGILASAFGTTGFCQAASSAVGGGPSAAPVVSQTSVVETQWNLVELNGSAVSVPADKGQVYIYLQQEGDKLSGSDGCNRFFGSYDLSGSSLQFHSVARTMMACRGSFTDREAEFLEALKQATNYLMSGSILQLKVDDRVLARFQARKK